MEAIFNWYGSEGNGYKKYPDKILSGTTKEDLFKKFRSKAISSQYARGYYRFADEKLQEEYREWDGKTPISVMDYYGNGVVD